VKPLEVRNNPHGHRPILVDCRNWKGDWMCCAGLSLEEAHEVIEEMKEAILRAEVLALVAKEASKP
jgi:hypothetical protein